MREYWSARDPLKLYVDYLLGKGGLSPADLAPIDEKIGAIIEDAIAYAEAQPFPRPETVSEGVFAP
jgi:pyruvate dehydrogenase E1 component alpha subunit